MLDISRINSHYKVRAITASDVDDVLKLYRQNPQFYQYTEAEPTRKQVLHDMTITPQGIKVKDKYFFGFFENRTLVAVMDLIDGYPKPEIAYIGLFMMNQDYQGRQIGTSIIGEATDYIWTTGKTAIRLAIDKGNPQSTHFWKKNGFEVVSESEVNGWTKLVAERGLR
jgi:RimJ/RimL family protein N-acetyltransferase